MKTIKELEAEIKKGSPIQLVLQERINTLKDVLELIDSLDRHNQSDVEELKQKIQGK